MEKWQGIGQIVSEAVIKREDCGISGNGSVLVETFKQSGKTDYFEVFGKVSKLFVQPFWFQALKIAFVVPADAMTVQDNGTIPRRYCPLGGAPTGGNENLGSNSPE
jgi:hypothetical protein